MFSPFSGRHPFPSTDCTVCTGTVLVYWYAVPGTGYEYVDTLSSPSVTRHRVSRRPAAVAHRHASVRAKKASHQQPTRVAWNLRSTRIMTLDGCLFLLLFSAFSSSKNLLVVFIDVLLSSLNFEVLL